MNCVYSCIMVYVRKMILINYDKILKKFEEKGITTYEIRNKGIIPQSTLTKFKNSSGATMEDVKENLKKFQEKNGKELAVDVNTKTIEDLCQLFQCQPSELIDWEVELKPELSYENRYKQPEE